MGTRLRNADWRPGDEAGIAPTWERVSIAILLDIRDELQHLNRTMDCPNTRAIPEQLRKIGVTLKHIELDTLPAHCYSHPRYQGKREPKADCRACRKVFRLVQAGR